MRITEVKTAKERDAFLRFRKEKYRQDKKYVDNCYFMLTEIFGGKLHFVKEMTIRPVYVEDDGICCEAVMVWAPQLPEYIQLCFFEARPGHQEAVNLLLRETESFGRENGCSRMVIGLNGHVNYGLGLLSTPFGKKNSFSSPGNPEYYNTYFRAYGCDTIGLNSYHAKHLERRFDKFEHVLKRLYRHYTFRFFDKKHFERDAEIYTKLNNLCFSEHRYYYKRENEDDAEMLKELFLFMKEDSLIYAFDGEEPVGFLLWYPDYNELARPGEIFGVPHYFRNLLHGRRIRTAKVMEYGVLEKKRGTGLPLALLHQAYKRMALRGIDRIDTSWILAENEDSNSFCQALCDGIDREYAVYEKAL